LAADHIPARVGLVDGNTCRVLRSGIVMHLNLGECGGGHHDAGPHFPMARFVALVKAFQHPVAKKRTRAQLRATARKAVLALRASGETWTQIKATAAWRLYVKDGGR